MDEMNKKNVEELDDDALENAAGGLGRGQKDPGTGKSQRDLESQNNDN